MHVHDCRVVVLALFLDVFFLSFIFPVFCFVYLFSWELLVWFACEKRLPTSSNGRQTRIVPILGSVGFFKTPPACFLCVFSNPICVFSNWVCSLQKSVHSVQYWVYLYIILIVTVADWTSFLLIWWHCPFNFAKMICLSLSLNLVILSL